MRVEAEPFARLKTRERSTVFRVSGQPVGAKPTPMGLAIAHHAASRAGLVESWWLIAALRDAIEKTGRGGWVHEKDLARRVDAFSMGRPLLDKIASDAVVLKSAEFVLERPWPGCRDFLRVEPRAVGASRNRRARSLPDGPPEPRLEFAELYEETLAAELAARREWKPMTPIRPEHGPLNFGASSRCRLRKEPHDRHDQTAGQGRCATRPMPWSSLMARCPNCQAIACGFTRLASENG